MKSDFWLMLAWAIALISGLLIFFVGLFWGAGIITI